MTSSNDPARLVGSLRKKGISKKINSRKSHRLRKLRKLRKSKKLRKISGDEMTSSNDPARLVGSLRKKGISKKINSRKGRRLRKLRKLRKSKKLRKISGDEMTSSIIERKEYFSNDPARLVGSLRKQRISKKMSSRKGRRLRKLRKLRKSKKLRKISGDEMTSNIIVRKESFSNDPLRLMGSPRKQGISKKMSSRIGRRLRKLRKLRKSKKLRKISGDEMTSSVIVRKESFSNDPSRTMPRKCRLVCLKRKTSCFNGLCRKRCVEFRYPCRRSFGRK